MSTHPCPLCGQVHEILVTPPPPPPPPPPPSGKIINVAVKTSAAVAAAFSQAVKGDTVHCPAGVYPGADLVVPEGVHLSGTGIYHGGSGTWLQFGLKWGAGCSFDKLLVGVNAAGRSCAHRPLSRVEALSRKSYPDTAANGAHDVAFSLVRFKGGADSGGALFDLSSNWSRRWRSDALRTVDMIRHTFNDCEFERPQAKNSVGVTSTFSGGNPGSVFNLWWDVRKGGSYLTGNRWNRCHFGVRNGYHTGLDGYGIGTTFLIQPAPSASGADLTGADIGPSLLGGSSLTLANWNPAFDWAQVHHGASDNAFSDCLFEYSCWYPMDLCDFGRTYSCWQGAKLGAKDQGKSLGYGNPPGAKWPTFPEAVWNDRIGMTRLYHKGGAPQAHGVVAEICRNSFAKDCYCGTGSVFNQGVAGTCGNTASGSWPGGHPTSPIFDRDWSGTGSTYTPSPFDPA